MPTDMGAVQLPNFEGIEANELIYSPIYMDDAMQGFTFIPVAGHRKKMKFLRKLENIVQKWSGCGFTPKGNLNQTNRTLEVSDCKADLEFCWDELKDTIEFEMLKADPAQRGEMQGTLVEDLFTKRVQDALKLDYQRLMWFGDKASTNADYDLVDGIFKYLDALQVSNAIPLHTVGATLSAGDGTAILAALEDNAHPALQAMDNKAYYVSYSVYNRYMKDLEAFGAIESAYQLRTNGARVLTYRGIPVIPMRRWDLIDASLNSANKHRAVLTVAENIVVGGGSSADNYTSLRFIQDEINDKTLMKAKFKVGFDYIAEELFSYARAV